jgi:hypothetical protein
VFPTHFHVLHVTERPFAGLTWPQLVALAAVSPFLIWIFVSPLSVWARTAALIPLCTAGTLVVGQAQDPIREAILGCLPFLVRRHRWCIVLAPPLPVFRP